MRSRGAARLLVVLLAVAVTAGSVSDCLVDEPMTRAQMACCAGMQHECGAPAADRECCATHSKDRQVFSASGFTQPHGTLFGPLAPAGRVAPEQSFSAAFVASRFFGQDLLKLPERPTYLLVSSFLI